MMTQIKVTRKSYVRKDGTVVEGTTYYTIDQGKPGKTPESAKFYHPKMEMHWHKDQSFDVVEGKTTVLTFDFDAEKSVNVTGQDKVMIKPVVKLDVKQK
jgi:hypothetical protein